MIPVFPGSVVKKCVMLISWSNIADQVEGQGLIAFNLGIIVTAVSLYLSIHKVYTTSCIIYQVYSSLFCGTSIRRPTPGMSVTFRSYVKQSAAYAYLDCLVLDIIITSLKRRFATLPSLPLRLCNNTTIPQHQ